MATIVLGAAFGDEGKGKLVDILCRDVQFCARAQVRIKKQKCSTAYICAQQPMVTVSRVRLLRAATTVRTGHPVRVGAHGLPCANEGVRMPSWPHRRRQWRQLRLP